MKIRTRLTIYFTVLVMSLIIVKSLLMYGELSRYNNDQFYKRLSAMANTKAILLFKVQNMDSTRLKTIDLARNDILIDENISVFDTSGRQIYTNNDTLNFLSSPELFKEVKARKEIHYEEGPYKIVAIYYEDEARQAFVTAGAIDLEGEGLLNRARLILITTSIGSIIIVVLMGWFFVGRALEPISSIVQKVRTISPTRFGRLPALTERDEIAELVKTFNELFDKLEDAFRAEKSFVANVSHELNNPLAKIKSQIDVALIQNRENESYRSTLKSVLEDVNELIVLITDLLNLSRVSSGQELRKAPLRIDELLFEVRDTLMTPPSSNKILIDFTDPPLTDNDFLFSGNKYLLTTALHNLLENACKFSRDNTATINLGVRNGHIVVIVTDNGPGIPEGDITHIFELFFRSSGQETVKGYGIGLALAKKILAVHGVDISVHSEVGEGTSFTLQF